MVKQKKKPRSLEEECRMEMEEYIEAHASNETDQIKIGNIVFRKWDEYSRLNVDKKVTKKYHIVFIDKNGYLAFLVKNLKDEVIEFKTVSLGYNSYFIRELELNFFKKTKRTEDDGITDFAIAMKKRKKKEGKEKK